MCLMIVNFDQRSGYRRRTSDATDPGSDHTGAAPLRTTFFAPGAAPCPTVAPGSYAEVSPPHGLGFLAANWARHKPSPHP
jgi:hypothetical protein